MGAQIQLHNRQTVNQEQVLPIFQSSRKRRLRSSSKMNFVCSLR